MSKLRPYIFYCYLILLSLIVTVVLAIEEYPLDIIFIPQLFLIIIFLMYFGFKLSLLLIFKLINKL